MNRKARTGLVAVLAVAALGTAAAADTVPDVVGLRLEQSGAMLGAAGFRAEPSYDAGQPAGVVFSQDPGGLANRPKGTVIRVKVGGEAPAAPAPAPSVPEAPPAGELPPIADVPPAPPAPPAPEAPRVPTAGPIPVAPPVIEEAPPSGPAPRPDDWPLPPPGVRNPGGGPGAGETEEAPPAVLDALTASAIPEPMPNRDGPALPNTIQRTQGEAQGALSRWRVNLETTLAAPQLVGRVLNQVPAPGETLAPGEMVTIVIGLSDLPSIDHHVVPPVEGLPVAEAKARMEREGFRVSLRSVPSTADMVGRVVSQSPLPVSLGVKGTEIVLRLGRGTGARPAGTPRLPPSTPAAPAAPFAPTGPPSTPGGEPTDLGPPPAGPGGRVAPPGAPTPPPAPPVVPPVAPTPTPPPTAPVPPTTPPVAPPPAPSPGPGKLAVAQPIAPAEGATFPRAYGATFQWTSVPGADRYEWELQEEQTGTAWRTVTTLVFKETRHRPERLERGRFRWRVRALGDGTQGDWSGWFRLFMY